MHAAWFPFCTVIELAHEDFWATGPIFDELDHFLLCSQATATELNRINRTYFN